MQLSEKKSHATTKAGRKVAATATKPKRPRVQLDFNQAAFDRLNELVEISGADSMSDLFRRSLRLFDWYQVRKSEGYELLIEKDRKRVRVDLGL